MPVSNQDIQLCFRVCNAAGNVSIRIREHDTALGHSFTWRLANGTDLPGPLTGSRETALIGACKTLLPLIFNHV